MRKHLDEESAVCQQHARLAAGACQSAVLLPQHAQQPQQHLLMVTSPPSGETRRFPGRLTAVTVVTAVTAVTLFTRFALSGKTTSGTSADASWINERPAVLGQLGVG